MHRYARHMHDICTNTYKYIHFPRGTLQNGPVCICIYLIVSVCISAVCSRQCISVCIYVYAYVFSCILCIYQHVHINFQQAYVQKNMHMYVSCMYHVCIFFFACIWYVSCMWKYVYVLLVLTQTNTLTVITWRNDLLQGRQHAGPTQGSHEQVPICFIPPSMTPPQTRFGAPPRAARVEGVQLGFRVSPIGPPYAFIHW